MIKMGREMKKFPVNKLGKEGRRINKNLKSR